MLAVAYKNNIKSVLDSRGWSVRKLAMVLDKDYAFVHRLVNTDPMPDGITVGTLKPVAKALGVPLDSLVGQEVNGAS